jgi:uncharacterized protein YcbX
MRITGIGVTALKGARHGARSSVELATSGPVGDREFAVIDVERGRVLKTVENPQLLGCEASFADGVLTVEIGGRALSGVPASSGRRVDLEYWGRPAAMDVVDGPWAAEFSRLLGREVLLGRAAAPGAVVYGDPVTITTTSSLRRLARETGREIDARRFRSTLVIDTPDDAAHVEDSWAGRDLDVGAARLTMLGGVPRCAVIDLDPRTGERGSGLLKALAGYRLQGGDIMFAAYARVTRPGTVVLGDAVALAG